MTKGSQVGVVIGLVVGQRKMNCKGKGLGVGHRTGCFGVLVERWAGGFSSSQSCFEKSTAIKNVIPVIDVIVKASCKKIAERGASMGWTESVLWFLPIEQLLKVVNTGKYTILPLKVLYYREESRGMRGVNAGLMELNVFKLGCVLGFVSKQIFRDFENNGTFFRRCSFRKIHPP